jgi:hypothetical protein
MRFYSVSPTKTRKKPTLCESGAAQVLFSNNRERFYRPGAFQEGEKVMQSVDSTSTMCDLSGQIGI